MRPDGIASQKWSFAPRHRNPESCPLLNAELACPLLAGFATVSFRVAESRQRTFGRRCALASALSS
jgi:hypothetical protein